MSHFPAPSAISQSPPRRNASSANSASRAACDTPAPASESGGSEDTRNAPPVDELTGLPTGTEEGLLVVAGALGSTFPPGAGPTSRALTSPALVRAAPAVLLESLTKRIEPNRPWVSSSGPAAKYRAFVSPADLPLPKVIPHRPSITIGLPVSSLSWPRNWPVSALKALILPLPKLPTRSALLKGPKSLGAMASPHGALRWLPLSIRSCSWPLVLKTSTKPAPRSVSSLGSL